MANDFKPDYLIHPSYFIKRTLDEYSMTQKDLSSRTGISEKHIVSIIKGESPISPDTALKLESVFGISAGYWNNLQKLYEETKARLEAEAKLKEEIKMLSKFSVYKELADNNYLEYTMNKSKKVNLLRSFFGVSSLDNIIKTYSPQLQFRKSENEPDKYSLIAWLRCGEIEFRKETIPEFSVKELKTSLNSIRELSRKPFPEALNELKETMKRAGVFFVLLPYFKNTYTNGVIRWIGENPIIQISTLNKYQDIFWFTVFHEICHVFKHRKKDVIFEFEKKTENDEETEADKFAGEILIPGKEYQVFINKNDFSDSSIKSFAKSLSISPGVVVGRLSHDNFLNWHTKQHLREKIEN
jgi:HTH-type transcriptional regulator / antitoxin HigA